jgi:hypothetical protein
MTSRPESVAKALIDRFGYTYAQQAGIQLADKPSPLYQLLVLATLVSARISAHIAVAAARGLFTRAGRNPKQIRGSAWPAAGGAQVVAALRIGEVITPQTSRRPAHRRAHQRRSAAGDGEARTR